MPIEEEPVVGATYKDEEGRSFEVMSFDEDAGAVGVKYEDETLDEIDLDAWYEMEIKRVSSPEDREADDDEELEDDDDLDEDDDEDDDEEDYDEEAEA